MTKMVPHTGKILLAHHLGKKRSATEPSAAPSSSAALVRGHFQPDETSTIPSITTADIAPQVQPVIQLKTPEMSTNRIQTLSTMKIRE
jgi:hypothetical protein